MGLLGDLGEVDACFSPFGDSDNSMQDRCTVCTQRAIASDVMLGALDGTTR